MMSCSVVVSAVNYSSILCTCVQVEGLLEDVDFRLRVTREELDGICTDLYERAVDPVRQALEAADMTMVSWE